MGRGLPTVRQWPILWVGVYPQRVEGYLSESDNVAVNKKTPFQCMTAPNEGIPSLSLSMYIYVYIYVIGKYTKAILLLPRWHRATQVRVTYAFCHGASKKAAQY